MNYYETLGVDREATKDEIKKAFRKKAEATHPDKKGGSEKAFKNLNEAYLVLKDPIKRERYDLGKYDKYEPESSPVFQIVAQMFNDIFIMVAESGDFTMDIIQTMKRGIRDQISKGLNQIAKNEKVINNMNKIKARIISKNTLAVDIIEGQIKKIKYSTEQINKEIKVNEDVLEFLEDYKYLADAKQEVSFTISNAFGGATTSMGW